MMVDRSGWAVGSVSANVVRDWLLTKHYAKAVPPISLSFGLYVGMRLSGVCTFGPPARMLNDGYGLFKGKLEVQTFELNRLCVSDELPENSLSWFVAKALKQMPSPCALVSYADTNFGHHGYIYQATNWLYTGEASTETKFLDKETQKPVHARTVVSRYGSQAITPELLNHLDVVHQKKKHRYIYFVGDKRQKRNMRELLSYEVLPYPKGDNQRYEAGTTLAERSSLRSIFE